MKLSGLIPKFLLILVIFICSGSNLLFAKNIHFFDVQEKLLNRINELRAHPLSVARHLGLDIIEISRKWQGIRFDVSILPFDLNENLNKMAKNHIIEMVTNGYIGHKSNLGQTLEQRAEYFGYNGIFNGESIAVFCFENFVSVDNAIDVLWRDMVKDAFYRISAEGAPLLFPLYKDLGVGLAGGQITLNGNTYNAYILCLEFGVPGFSGYFLGRIFHEHPLPEYSISNLQIIGFHNGNFFSKIICFQDGSFYIPWDYVSELWLKIHDPYNRYQDKIIQVYTTSLNICLKKRQ